MLVSGGAAMGHAVTLFRVAGIPVRVHVSWLAIYGLLAWSLSVGYFPEVLPDMPVRIHWVSGFVAALLLFVSVFLHELSHSVVAPKPRAAGRGDHPARLRRRVRAGARARQPGPRVLDGRRRPARELRPRGARLRGRRPGRRPADARRDPALPRRGERRGGRLQPRPRLPAGRWARPSRRALAGPGRPPVGDARGQPGRLDRGPAPDGDRRSCARSGASSSEACGSS